MIPLCLGLSTDVYLLARLIDHSEVVAACVALAILACAVSCWFVLPIVRRRLRGNLNGNRAPGGEHHA
jgi:hypothetical protein